MDRTARRRGLLLALYGAGLSLALAAGFRMAVPHYYFQYLEQGALESRLGESLWNLHSQPPLLNLLLGLGLKLEKATGWAPERSLLILQIGAGAAALLAIATLLDRLEVAPWARRVVLALVVFDPALYFYVLVFFYPIYELLLLSITALLAHRFLSEGRPRDYAGAAMSLATLTYTRALFHFGWTLAVLLLLALAGRRQGRRLPGRAVVGALAAVSLLVLAWPAKNLVRFGFFGSSSWQGYNLSQGIIPTPPAIWEAFAFGDSPAIAAKRAQLARRVPPRFRTIPVLAEITKAPGVPNWNHHSILGLSARIQDLTLRRIARQPSLLGRKAAQNYRMATAYAARHWLSGELDWRARTPLAHAWLRIYEGVAFQFFGDDPRRGPWTGQALLLPAALAAVAVQMVRRRRDDPAGAGTAAFLLACVLWVLAMVLLVDGAEANRNRFSTQPLLLVSVAWALPRRPIPREQEQVLPEEGALHRAPDGQGELAAPAGVITQRGSARSALPASGLEPRQSAGAC